MSIVCIPYNFYLLGDPREAFLKRTKYSGGCLASAQYSFSIMFYLSVNYVTLFCSGFGLLRIKVVSNNKILNS